MEIKRRNRAIVSLAVGDGYQDLGKLTHPTIKAYAEKIKADFLVVDETSHTSPHWEKLSLFPKLMQEYERVLYVDTDIIIREDCPDLFELVPEDSLGMFEEGRFTDRSKELMIDSCKVHGIYLPDWNGKYYNSGVIVMSQAHKDLFDIPEEEYPNFYEQTYINILLSAKKIKMFELPYKFNRMICMDWVTGEERFDSYFIHYAGYPDLNYVTSLIPKDLERWKQDSHDFKYKKHIQINVGGGLGDQACAEPTIRFLKEHLYKDDDVVVLTHWKELFDHLPVRVFTYPEWNAKPKEDVPYFCVQSLPEPDSLQWFIVSHLLCHTVDYSSIAILKRELPLEDKRIKLEFSEQDLEKVKSLVPENFVIVHAGKHWRTKTFPVAWWNEVIDGILTKGKRVVLIGKEEDGRGTVAIDVKEGVTDLRDKLSLKELFALLSIKDSVLISNDSAPIHFAGAFDNKIILIPSCKHPDHVMPFRYKQNYWNGVALYKELLLNQVISHPTQVYETSADFDVDDWSKYLPEVNEVIREI